MRKGRWKRTSLVKFDARRAIVIPKTPFPSLPTCYVNCDEAYYALGFRLTVNHRKKMSIITKNKFEYRKKTVKNQNGSGPVK